MTVNDSECECGKPLSKGDSNFSQHLRKLGLCNACYRARPKVIKACKRPECDKRVAGGYGKVAVAARVKGFCRQHYLEWDGPPATHTESRTLAAIAKEVEAGFKEMDTLLATFGETVQDLDASAEVLERLVTQVAMKREAVSELEDALNQQVTVVSRRLKILAKKVLDA